MQNEYACDNLFQIPKKPVQKHFPLLVKYTHQLIHEDIDLFLGMDERLVENIFQNQQFRLHFCHMCCSRYARYMKCCLHRLKTFALSLQSRNFRCHLTKLLHDTLCNIHTKSTEFLRQWFFRRCHLRLNDRHVVGIVCVLHWPVADNAWDDRIKKYRIGEVTTPGLVPRASKQRRKHAQNKMTTPWLSTANFFPQTKELCETTLRYVLQFAAGRIWPAWNKYTNQMCPCHQWEAPNQAIIWHLTCSNYLTPPTHSAINMYAQN